MPIHSVTLSGKKQSTVNFTHIGQIPQAMLLRVPAENEILRKFRQNFQSFVYRDYDHTDLFSTEKSKIVNNVASLVHAAAGKRKAEAPSSSPKASRPKKKKSKKTKAALALVDEEEDEATMFEPTAVTAEDLEEVSQPEETLVVASPVLNVSETEGIVEELDIEASDAGVSQEPSSEVYSFGLETTILPGLFSTMVGSILVTLPEPIVPVTSDPSAPV